MRLVRVATYDDLPIDGEPDVVYLVVDEDNSYIWEGDGRESFYREYQP